MAMQTGLMAFWADFDDIETTALRQWHNCQHMSERVNIPGFSAGRRYRGFDSAATFLMYYETDTPEVLASDAYQNALNNPTPWTKEALKLFKNPARGVFRLVDEFGIHPTEPAFFLSTMRFNLTDQDIVARYREYILQELAQQDSVLRVRLWENLEGISSIKTKEASIYGDGPGRQQFALFIEHRYRPQTISLSALPGLSNGDRDKHANDICELGWLDFALG